MAYLNFTLYLNSSFPRSLWTNDIRNLTQLCQQFVGDDYSIDIIPAEDRQRAFHDGVLTTPTILLQTTDGRKQTLGNLAETEKFLRSMHAPVVVQRAQPLAILSMLPSLKGAL